MTPLSSNGGNSGGGGGVGGTTSTMSSSSLTTVPPLQLNLRNHCLFCLQPQPPSEIIELIKSNPKKILTFQPILYYLTGTDPTFDKLMGMRSCDDDKKKRVPLMRNLPPLCRSCYDMVAELDRLHKQLLDVQWLIKRQIEGVRGTLKKSRVPSALSHNRSAMPARLKFLGKLGDGRMSQEEVLMVRTFVDNLHGAIMEDNGSVQFPSKMPPNYVPTSDCPNTKSVHRVIVRNLHPLRDPPPGKKFSKHTTVGDNLPGMSSALGHTSSSATTDLPLNDEDSCSMMDTHDDDGNPPNDNSSSTLHNPAMSTVKAKSKAQRKSAKVRDRKRKERRATIRRYVNGISTAQTCDLCGEMIPISDIVSHLESHVKGYVTKCINSACPYVFSCPLKMERHIKIGNRNSACKKTANIPEGLWTKQCETCEFSTKILREFRIHLEGHEEQMQDKTLSCPIPNCEEKFALRQTVEIHISHHDLRPQNTDSTLAPVQPCPVCTESIDLDEMKAHLNEAHQVTETFTCELCPFVFPDEESQLKHISKHQNDKKLGFSCSICEGVKFQTHEFLRQHYLNVHNITRHLTCEHCDEKFSHPMGLALHKRRFHWSSYQEERATLRNNSRSSSAKLKLSKSFECDICSEPIKFLFHSTLLSHKLKVHGMPLKCENCEQTFSSLPLLKEHLREHFRSSRTFTCTVENCGKVFPRATSLRAHECTVHREVMPYICSSCGKAYLHKKSLEQHARIVHLGVRHICDVCGVSFTSNDNLKNHMLTHNNAVDGDKSHGCPVCKKAFLYKSMMLQHVRLYHKDESQEKKVKASTSTTSGEK